MCDVMCGAIYPRNSQGVGKEGSILLDKYIYFFLDIAWYHNSMILGCMVFCSVISILTNNIVPDEMKFLLGISVSKLVVPHVP